MEDNTIDTTKGQSSGETKATKRKEQVNSEQPFTRKRTRQGSKSDKDEKQRPSKRPLELETNATVLERRQKQIDYGKNTVGYYNFLLHVPIDKRTKEHPKTPDKYTKYSRRSWDTLIKIWRKRLHEYDTEATSHDTDDSDIEEQQ